MKIIKPSFEILDDLNGEKILKKIELCGRVCYKSEDKITAGSAEKFIRNIIQRGHESVLEHVSFSVRFIVDRGVSHEIVRHRLASFCVSGDTMIPSFTQKKRTIAEIYEWSKDPFKKAALENLIIRSMDEESHTIVPNTIKNVFYNGKKGVYRVTTESGRTIKCTKQHRFFTDDGWKQLGEIKKNDFILSNGFPLLENEDWIRHNYLELNKTRTQVAQEIGCCEATLFKAFKKFGIRKPWSDRPNPHPGRGIKGMFTEEAKMKISMRMRGENNPSYKQDRSSLSLSGGYSEANRIFEKKECEFCGCKENLEIHHIDKNPKNNTKENIKILCTKCHNLWHKDYAKGAFQDKVVNIEYVGVEDVYDLEMNGQYHNYIANGVVVHNSQESTRYCRYGNEITVINPCYLQERTPAYEYWYDACERAEQRYMEMLDEGYSPQEARAVLPNSLKTELIVSANIREWRHILKLRTSQAAHPQIREVMIPLLRELQKKIPVVFDDIEVE